LALGKTTIKAVEFAKQHITRTIYEAS
jgi:hypothetical protein